MTTYITRIYEPHPEPPELQVLHKYPMTEPGKPHGEDRATLWAPTRAELDEATARTQAAIDAGASRADVEHLAQLEEKTHQQYLQRPGADAELQRDAEQAERDYEMEAGG